jgi:hypothetical protein
MTRTSENFKITLGRVVELYIQLFPMFKYAVTMTTPIHLPHSTILLVIIRKIMRIHRPHSKTHPSSLTYLNTSPKQDDCTNHHMLPAQDIPTAP